MNATTLPRRDSTVHQIVDENGDPYLAARAANGWVSSPTRFADPTEGNAITAFTTGKSYFADLLSEIKKAQSQILIAGWQINWDALMAPGVRLFDTLLAAAKANPALKIYIMPWDDTEPMQTYDDETVSVFLNVMNTQLGRTQVYARVSPTYATVNAGYFSHHQKQVVIDGKLAYIGGMDLAYGRYCDEHYTLVANADGREAMNRYNGCVEQVGKVTAPLVNPDDLTGAVDNFKITGHSNADIAAKHICDGAWQVKYKQNKATDVVVNSARVATNASDATTLDAAIQPRMPWQDVHCRVEGPAASDLMRNFVSRWNIKANNSERLVPAPSPSSQPRKGNAHIQVLRSAPHNHCLEEYKALASKQGSRPPQGTQCDILTAMLQLIQNSLRFIYIENQFFVSYFGSEAPHSKGLSPAAQFIKTYGGDNQQTGADVALFANTSTWKQPTFSKPSVFDTAAALQPPTNLIVKQLLERIEHSALSSSPFHVYITVPVHPEGCLSAANIVTQVYWTMQTLVFGSNSLLNGIRRIIKARELLKAKAADYMDVIENPDNTQYLDISLEQCEEFVTLLNLRNWAKLGDRYVGDRYVTEQIYVHTKVMIVDDLFAIVGSANINDRSLLGERDSELAVLVMDGDTQRADVNGAGSNRVVRNFAYNLRKDLWKKIFGITDGKSPASELKQAIEQPGSPDSWKLIQRRAKQNAALFEDAFNWVPRNVMINSNGSSEPAHVIPTWDSTKKSPKPKDWNLGDLSSPMPFQPEFWTKPRHNVGAASALSKIKGFITALPIEWTKGEYDHFDYPTPLVADNNVPTDANDDIKIEQAAITPVSIPYSTG